MAQAVWIYRPMETSCGRGVWTQPSDVGTYERVDKRSNKTSTARFSLWVTAPQQSGLQLGKKYNYAGFKLTVLGHRIYKICEIFFCSVHYYCT